MKKVFEKREKTIVTGLVSMLANATHEEKGMKKERKITDKLLNKLTGENLEVDLKPDEVKIIKMILDNVIQEGKRPLVEGEKPAMLAEDLTVCENLKTKL